MWNHTTHIHLPWNAHLHMRIHSEITKYIRNNKFEGDAFDWRGQGWKHRGHPNTGGIPLASESQPPQMFSIQQISGMDLCFASTTVNLRLFLISKKRKSFFHSHQRHLVESPRHGQSFTVDAAASEPAWPLPVADARLQSPSGDRTLLLCKPASSLTLAPSSRLSANGAILSPTEACVQLLLLLLLKSGRKAWLWPTPQRVER